MRAQCMLLRRAMLVSRAFMAWAKIPARLRAPLEASSEAQARQQCLPGVGEQDAREVGGYDDDEADYADNDSEASQGPASDAECWLGGPPALNDPRWAQMSVAAEFGLGKKAMRNLS